MVKSFFHPVILLWQQSQHLSAIKYFDIEHCGSTGVLESKITQIIPCYNTIISGGENTFLHLYACKSYSTSQRTIKILIKLKKRNTFFFRIETILPCQSQVFLLLVFLCRAAGACPFTINLSIYELGQSAVHHQKQQNMSLFALFLYIGVCKMTSLTVCWLITPFLADSTLSGHNLEGRGNGHHEWGGHPFSDSLWWPPLCHLQPPYCPLSVPDLEGSSEWSCPMCSVWQNVGPGEQ